MFAGLQSLVEPDGDRGRRGVPVVLDRVEDAVFVLDPELRGPAARNFVLASAGAAMLGLPLFVMMQKPVTGWPDTYPGAPLMTMALLAIYVVVVISVARRATPLRFLRPLTSMWPDRPEEESDYPPGG